MVWLSNLQKETLLKVNEMIEQNKTFDEIVWKLQKENYYFKCETKNGYTKKSLFMIYKDNENGKEEYSFVDLKRRRNGLAYWETIKIS